MSKLTWGFIAVILIAAFSIIYLLLGWVQDIDEAVAKEAVLRPSIDTPLGVDVTSSFSLTFPENVSSASVGRYLQVEPEIELGVHQGKTASEVLLVPAQPLNEGTVYVFTLNTTGKPVSWAAQTSEPLAVSEHRPADQQTQTPLHAAMELTLNRTLPVDASRLKAYVTIDPAVSGVFSQQGQTLYFQPDNGWQGLTVYHVSLSALPLEDGELQLAEPVSFAFETEPDPEGPARTVWRMRGASVFTAAEAPSFALHFSDGDPGEGQETPEMPFSLYALPDAESFAACLCRLQWIYPQWGLGQASSPELLGREAKLLEAGTKPLQRAEDNSWLLQISPQAGGYYALCAKYQDQQCLQLFQVNDLSAFSAAGGNKLLIWAHHSLSGEPAANARVVAHRQEQTYTADSGGAILLDRFPQDEVYLLTHDGSTLVVQDFGYSPEEENKPFLWRYLYLDKDVYQNGDTLRFWGLVQPVDGSALAYERVSVYLYREGETAPLYRIYAPLDGYFFQGEWQLPYLRQGRYRLEISQSGKNLVDADFRIGEAAPAQNTEPTQAFSGPTISMGDSQLRLGESYRMAFDIDDAGSYLFIRDEGGIVGYAVEKQPRHLGLFEPENRRNYFLWGVAYRNGEYLITPPCSLLLNDDDRRANLNMEGDLPQRLGEESTVHLTAAPGYHVAVSLIKSETPPTAHVQDWIYGDLLRRNVSFAASTNGKRQVFSSPQAGADTARDFRGETEYFALLTADRQGRVSVTLSPQQTGEYYLLVETVGIDGEAYCATLCLPFAVSGADAGAEPQADTAAAYTWRQVYAGEAAQETAGEALLLADSGVRAAYWRYLLEEALQPAEETAASDKLFSAAAARAYLSSFAAENNEEPFFAFPGWEGESRQTDSGGIAPGTNEEADLTLSLLVAASHPQTVDASLLKAYFRGIMIKPDDRKSQVLALTGLAALRAGVVPEIYRLLESPDLTDSECFYLLWGLCLSGGEQNAKNCFTERFAAGVDAWCEQQAGAFSDEENWLLALLSLYWGGAEESAALCRYREQALSQPEGSLAQTILAITALENLYARAAATDLQINENKYEYMANGKPFLYRLPKDAPFSWQTENHNGGDIEGILIETEE
ncbi:MAG: hypothetical protein K6B40_08590 [Firmicutes bacterium]|nr:hypothetical protein [Bacillota bacterium]